MRIQIIKGGINMICEKCNENEHFMVLDFTQGGKNPNGKIEHICSDCFNNLMWRVKNV